MENAVIKDRLYKSRMAYIVVNYGEMVGHMDAHEPDEIIEKTKFYRIKGLWHDLIGFRYCYGKCNFFHELMRRSSGKTIIKTMKYFNRVMGELEFRTEINETLDKNGRNCLIIASKHCESAYVVDLIKRYDLDVSFYSKHGTSVLTYALKRKKSDLILFCLQRLNQSIYKNNEIDMEYFQRDLETFRKDIIETPLIDIQFFEALTEKLPRSNQRVSKISKPVYEPPQSFKGNRLQQVLRQVASQLYFRWKFYLREIELKDIQILYVEKIDDKAANNKPSIFIAATPSHIPNSIITEFRQQTFYSLLTTHYKSPRKNEKFIEMLSERFGKKLKERVWNSNKRKTKTTKRSRDIASLLECDDRKFQKVNFDKDNRFKLPFFDFQENTAYLVHVSNNHTGECNFHAEYVLSEIAKELRNTLPNIKTTIFGKSRPCLTCTSSLREANIDYYNTKTGLAALDSILLLNAKKRIECLNTLFESPSHVSQLDRNDQVIHIPQYDALSDSDDDDAAKPKREISPRRKKRVANTCTQTYVERDVLDSKTEEPKYLEDIKNNLKSSISITNSDCQTSNGDFQALHAYITATRVANSFTQTKCSDGIAASEIEGRQYLDEIKKDIGSPVKTTHSFSQTTNSDFQKLEDLSWNYFDVCAESSRPDSFPISSNLNKTEIEGERSFSAPTSPKNNYKPILFNTRTSPVLLNRKRGSSAPICKMSKNIVSITQRSLSDPIKVKYDLMGGDRRGEISC